MQLTSQDFKAFADVGIPRDVVIAAGIYRVDPQEGARLVGQQKKSGTPRRDCAGIVFPYRMPEADTIREYRLRRDNPEIDVSGKLLDKYLAPPGRSSLFYFTPSAMKAWFTDRAIPVVFVEGEKKALALQNFFDQRGEQVLVIGLSGVWNWRGTVGKTTSGNGARVSVKGPIPDFDLIGWAGRQVNIIFDADARKNPSVCAARAALAKELTARGAIVCVLEMPPEAETGAKGIDDLLGAKGANYVAQWLENERARVANNSRSQVKAACHIFTVTDRGVIAQPVDDAGNHTGAAILVSSPLWVEGVTRDGEGRNHGRLIRYRDADKREREQVVLASLFAGERGVYESIFLDLGVDIYDSKLLRIYLLQKPDARVLLTDHNGWHDGGRYVLGGECLGSANDERIYFAGERHAQSRVCGTLDDWRENVARLCIGNSRLIFAIAAAFAAVLLRILGVEGGGIHFFGGTSTGKTTVLRVALSVWGGQLHRWRATVNGVESLAAAHNDGFLGLDEIAEIDPRQIGETAYMLGNGQGKARQTKDGALRRISTWLILFLSTGEISMSDHTAQAGKRARGGMGVRLVDVPADAGQGVGIFDDLGEFPSAKVFADTLKENAAQFQGTAARAFIAKIIEESADDLQKEWREFRGEFHLAHCPQDAAAEVGRIADRFALLAFAGEMASELGITGWPAGEALGAITRVFDDWLAVRGAGRSDDDTAIKQVLLFLELHGDSRFRWLGKGDTRTLINRAGYVEGDETSGLTFYILPEVFRAEICKGYDHKVVARALQRKGLLRATHDLRCEKRTPDGKLKLYAVSPPVEPDTDEFPNTIEEFEVTEGVSIC